MSSFIFNSDSARRRGIRRWLFRFAIGFVILLAGGMFFNHYLAHCPKIIYKMKERQLLAYKIFSPEKYSMVAVGSSRINFGIDPETMQKELPEMRIYNCALSGGAINAEILDYAENSRLDWSAPTKIVLLELAPRALWKKLRSNQAFRMIKNKPSDEIRSLFHYSPDSLDALLSPINRDRWNGRGQRKKQSFPHCHTDTGWYEVVSDYAIVDSKLKAYLRLLERNPQEMCDTSESFSEVLDKTRQWRKRGVLVFGVEPPTHPSVKETEERLSRYDRAKMISDFEKAGGVFIPLKKHYQVRLDGSHLESREAKIFSREIAVFIHRFLQDRSLFQKDGIK